MLHLKFFQPHENFLCSGQKYSGVALKILFRPEILNKRSLIARSLEVEQDKELGVLSQSICLESFAPNNVWLASCRVVKPQPARNLCREGNWQLRKTDSTVTSCYACLRKQYLHQKIRACFLIFRDTTPHHWCYRAQQKQVDTFWILKTSDPSVLLFRCALAMRRCIHWRNLRISKNRDSFAISPCIDVQTEQKILSLFPIVAKQSGGHENKTSICCVVNAKLLCDGNQNLHQSLVASVLGWLWTSLQTGYAFRRHFLVFNYYFCRDSFHARHKFRTEDW